MMITRRNRVVLGLLSLPFSLATLAGDYELRRYTIDSGGTTASAGGNYELGGTIAQPDAGVMSGGDYALIGGFWGGTCRCRPDFDGDCAVGAFDLATLLGAWGPCPEPCASGHAAETCEQDLNGDCVVDAADLAELLGSWGTCGG